MFSTRHILLLNSGNSSSNRVSIYLYRSLLKNLTRLQTILSQRVHPLESQGQGQQRQQLVSLPIVAWCVFGSLLSPHQFQEHSSPASYLRSEFTRTISTASDEKGKGKGIVQEETTLLRQMQAFWFLRRVSERLASLQASEKELEKAVTFFKGVPADPKTFPGEEPFLSPSKSHLVDHYLPLRRHLQYRYCPSSLSEEYSGLGSAEPTPPLSETSIAFTHGIKVKVVGEILRIDEGGKYYFRLKVRIVNLTDGPIKLLSHHWYFIETEHSLMDEVRSKLNTNPINPGSHYDHEIEYRHTSANLLVKGSFQYVRIFPRGKFSVNLDAFVNPLSLANAKAPGP